MKDATEETQKALVQNAWNACSKVPIVLLDQFTALLEDPIFSEGSFEDFWEELKRRIK